MNQSLAKSCYLKNVMAAQKMSGPLALGFILYGMVWYGMVWGTLTRDPPGRYYIILKSTHRAISIAVLMHYHRLLWSRLVGLITRSLTEELQTHGLYRTIMWRLTALVHIFWLTMDVKQSKKTNGCFFLFFVSVSDPLFSRTFDKR